jgi:hypothetical protein
MKNTPALVLSVAYMVVIGWGMANHEIWMDEAQHILLARDSHSFKELIYNSRYEGHPPLWNILLFLITSFSHNVVWIQSAHLVIATCSVFLILRFAPFPLIAKLLIISGYFMLYEYSVLCRNYSLSLLFLILIMVYMTREKKNYILLFFLLILFINTHLFSCFISLPLLYILWKDRGGSNQRALLVGTVVFALFFFLCIISIIPPSDHFLNAFNTDGILSLQRFKKCCRFIILGLLPIPDLNMQNYWGNNYILTFNQLFVLILSASLLLGPLVFFFSNRNAFILFFTGTLVILGFVYFSPMMVATRHGGFLSMLLLAGTWLSNSNIKHKTSNESPGAYRRLRFIYFTTILSIQFFAGIIVFSLDIKRNFSNSQKAADYLNTNFSPSDCHVMLTHFTSGPPVALFSKHQLYYIEQGGYGTFCKWNTKPLYLTDSAMAIEFDKRINKYKRVVLLSNQAVKIEEVRKNQVMRDTRFKKLVDFTDGTIRSENFSVYLLEKIH